MSRPLSVGRLPGLFLVMILGIGCNVSVPSSVPPAPLRLPAATTTDAATSPITKSGAESTIGPKSLELREMNWEQVLSFVAEHKGKVVVVDAWSTSCEPCLQEFPHLVALQQRHGEDVVCISFDCDYIGAKNKPVEYYRERVVKALADLKAETIVNLMSNVAADELFQQMDLDSIPAVYVFNREGQLAKRFDSRTPVSDGLEGVSYEKQIDPLVAKLVMAPKP